MIMFLHDFISHPIMAIFNLLGFNRAGRVVHNITLPDELDGVLVINGDEYALTDPKDESGRIGMIFGELYQTAKGKVQITKEKKLWAVHFSYKKEVLTVEDESLEVAMIMALDHLGY